MALLFLVHAQAKTSARPRGPSTTIIKPDSLRLAPYKQVSLGHIQANPSAYNYETIPRGGPCAHFESSCQLFKKE